MNHIDYYNKRVRILKENKFYEGLLIPSESDYFLLKLDNGYNIGISKNSKIELIEDKNNKNTTTNTTTNLNNKIKTAKINKKLIETKSNIFLLHTGGTIASKIDYKTGAVIAGYSPEDIIKKYPEVGAITTKFIANIQSEMMNFNHYNLIADAIETSIKEGAKGIIITHGTDTLHYTASALSFIFQKIPIVIVGSQRSSDRPSTDAKLNLIGAVKFIKESIKLGIEGVFISSHNSTNDDEISILKGLNSRKMHTSRRDTFKQINSLPFALVKKDKITFLSNNNNIKQNTSEIKRTRFNSKLKIGFLKSHPNMFKEEIMCYKDYDGLIIEGTGLGHIPSDEVDEYTRENKELFNSLKYLIDKGVVVAMAPQTIYGRINLNVYSPQRRLKQIGVLGDMCDMSPETAFIKLSWLLSNYSREQTKELYSKNMFGEILTKIHYDGYI